MSIKNRSKAEFFNTIRDYIAIMILDFVDHYINSTFKLIFASFWLLLCGILLSAFSANLYDSLVTKQLIDRINSWNDLYTKPHWKES